MKQIYIATNNGDMGGGEVMLLNLARAVRRSGYKVTIVGPQSPSEVIECAKDEGFTTISLPADNRKSYMLHLRAWDKVNREGLLWCNGLLPSLATAGHKNRVVHLHQLPRGKQRLVFKLARRGATRVLVPSTYVASQVAGSEVLANWVHQVELPLVRQEVGKTVRVGFLGRVSDIKGSHILAQAIELLNQSSPGRYRLVIGGEARFVEGDGLTKTQHALNGLGNSVEYLGWINPTEFFQGVDLVVMPSIIGESFGLVAAEAMSARVPLIVSNAGALPEVVGEDYPWIAKAGNPVQLAHVINQCVDNLLRHREQADEVMSASYWRWHELYSPQAGEYRVQAFLGTLTDNRK